ncbi:hypothetical protein [Sphingobium sp. D43FB]|uniref:hypothetical protein n=1 Tax=Sphingobium sp. D43FB TaxID=2017595 RepID=UPI000BB569AD|nr:hypothetical protein [Sphingobium sp. D43FB]PBN41131.1 hypothetical protein SxD43FB_23725 [Sphingobium sp. D43FB]
MILNFPPAPGLLGTFGQIISRALLRVVDQDSAAEQIILVDTETKRLYRLQITNGQIVLTPMS